MISDGSERGEHRGGFSRLYILANGDAGKPLFTLVLCWVLLDLRLRRMGIVSREFKDTITASKIGTSLSKDARNNKLTRLAFDKKTRTKALWIIGESVFRMSPGSLACE